MGSPWRLLPAGRRTQSSYPQFLANSNASDLTVSVYVPNGGGATRSLTSELSRLPEVKSVRTVVAPSLVPLARSGAPRLGSLAQVTVLGSLDGQFADQDHLAVAQGRLVDPSKVDEMVMTASAAQLLGVHVGQVVPMGFYAEAQSSLPGFGTPKVAPRLKFAVRVVGIFVFDNAIVQDDVDRAYGFIEVSPALIRKLAAVSPANAAPIGYALQLRQASREVPVVEQEIVRLLPRGATVEFHVTARVVQEVELAIKPESLALGGFGAIAALVCLVLGTQAVSRQLRVNEDDRRVMYALGAGPAMTTGDGLIGVLASVVIGSLLAAGLAVALSPIAPSRTGATLLPRSWGRLRLERARRRSRRARSCSRWRCGRPFFPIDSSI